MTATDVVRGAVTVRVAAPPERVWAAVGDLSRMGEWSPECERIELLDGATAPAVGTRFKGHNRRGRAKWTTTCEVTAWEPGRVLAFAVGSAAKPQTVWRYDLAPADGGTDLTESFELVKPIGPVSRLVTRVTLGVTDRRADLEDGARRTVEAVQRAVEAG
jgi:uncharacterized protein YndB with AHSA1/START domain